MDLRWIPLSAVHEVPLIDVTEFVLEEINRTIKNVSAEARQSPETVPLFSYYRGKPFIRNYGDD